MPINRIQVMPDSELLSELRQLVRNMKQAKARADAVRAVLDSMTDGTDFTAIETALGLSAGEGEVVYNIVSGVQGTDLEAANITAMVSRLG